MQDLERVTLRGREKATDADNGPFTNRVRSILRNLQASVRAHETVNTQICLKKKHRFSQFANHTHIEQPLGQKHPKVCRRRRSVRWPGSRRGPLAIVVGSTRVASERPERLRPREGARAPYD
ncbi:hypothetical protein EVAR_43072_1 [Eumeta japonica]|uniref:Uncharacterized protein n=1 Tax=Eumeta variegata TaxID=151549 RepID=A0A4C1WV63_EUMVA|nr:hypothetical protein EVAR_43072_1 [Eumeta japonica]